MEPKPVRHSEVPAYPTHRDVLQKGRISVAPIFEHGEGRGATGCVVVSPPVFLSEEEGMQVLREELAKHGIQLKKAAALEGVRIPRQVFISEFDGLGTKIAQEMVAEAKKHAKPLKLDGTDSDKRIAVKFVSRNDYFDLGAPMSETTVQGYDFKVIAEHVATEVKKQANQHVFFGVFYDPLAREFQIERHKDGEKIDIDVELRSQERRGKDDSATLLRRQAQDFIAWLKEQKAIE
jgi:hypothetical protein